MECLMGPFIFRSDEFWHNHTSDKFDAAYFAQVEG